MNDDDTPNPPEVLARNQQGRWVPAEPLPGTFGLRWERALAHRRSLGQSLPRALVGGWRDTRAVDRITRSKR